MRSKKFSGLGGYRLTSRFDSVSLEDVALFDPVDSWLRFHSMSSLSLVVCRNGDLDLNGGVQFDSPFN